jgi:spermidine synthase
MVAPSSPRVQYFLFAAFALSGFSGLIYESVWTNYLKFFLGHAAYAQSLVLAMFMGGMAGGAWLSSRFNARISNPLLAYATIEALIGLFGIFFHDIFVAANALLYGSLLPGVDAPLAVEIVRWGLAAALILPQTLLLGATFPLMSVGVLRAFPNTPGRSISLLYFTNSIGAVVGVLVSGFILIDAVGLPGAMLAAGLINILLAIAVYGCSKGKATPATADTAKGQPAPPLLRPMLLVAMVTGLSSFIYEVSWIRMLSMITGASTHAFELMLSAFILGLALGGLWLRQRIDRYAEPLVALGVIQLLMGTLALCSVLAYNPGMEVMAELFKSLRQIESAYLVFNFSSHAMAMALMLPTTFMAGMTLPLITMVLYRNGGGEAAIGKVYSFNTLGAIAGIILAAMLLLPLVGLKMAVLIGAALDLALALYLFSRSKLGRARQAGAWFAVAAALLAGVLSPPFDTALMSNSIFRGAGLGDYKKKEVLLHRDGRTATVDVTRFNKTMVTIATNGKPDATVNVGEGHASADEPTMVLLGALPQLLNTRIDTAAMIGMGAGTSADVMLTDPALKQLDVVEIESAMVEGARLFGTRSARAFSDARSHIHIDDAKSYFSSHKKRYDVIVSEPSDTWVSGVSTLFTNEFYGRIRQHLTTDGLLVQWVATYGSSPEIFASIMKAISKNFGDYRLYAATDTVLVIVAKVNGVVPELDPKGFSNPALAAVLARVGISSINDLHAQEIGRKAMLDPVFQLNGAPVNSDYFPFVDQHAVKARYLANRFNDMTSLHTAGMPWPGAHFEGERPVSDNEQVRSYEYRNYLRIGRQLTAYFAGKAEGPIPSTSPPSFVPATVLRNKPACHDKVAQHGWQQELIRVARVTIPSASAAELAPMVAFLRGQVCDSDEAKSNRQLLDLVAALSARDMPSTERTAQLLMAKGSAASSELATYASNALMLSYYQQRKWAQAQALAATGQVRSNVLTDIVLAHARMAAQPSKK